MSDKVKFFALGAVVALLAVWAYDELVNKKSASAEPAKAPISANGTPAKMAIVESVAY